MNNQTFRMALDGFLQGWKDSSLKELERFISTDYQAREVRDGEIEAFKYEESMEGWKQGFAFINEHDAEWEIHEVAIIPLKEDETLAILYATIVLDGKPMETGNLFSDTFKKVQGNWKLVRSYIETGIGRGKVRETIERDGPQNRS
ncbi:flavoprotein [Bacillus sp. AFS015802]|uniref:nuclear transport factor 2 family protein n=1 Tax=Bacillus sp. AFS015802 TaxID=2033486 RepID=UPI000BF79D6F|nr:nuclear transport factor 2 family protein [Bacillus sp. AFS015802]PFA62847.1 flavoprotein [Bacillus sp. AFS015802]